MAKHGNESRELLQKIQQEKVKGTIVKRFEDEFFALDLLKVSKKKIPHAVVKVYTEKLMGKFQLFSLPQWPVVLKAPFSLA